MPDPPIGRVGYVFEGALGNGRAVNLHKRDDKCCLTWMGNKGCHRWFPAHLHRCPHCDNPLPPHAKNLRTGQLNRHLFGHAQHALSEPAFARGITSNVPEAAI